MEAEEIVKQLDKEQLEETSTSTTTDGRDPTFDPALNPRPLPHVDTSVEEGEIITEADMPPLTGECLRGLFHLYCCLKLRILTLSHLISCGIQQQLSGCPAIASSRRDLRRGLGSF